MRQITEYLLTKKNPRSMNDPENGCKVEEICNWLEYNGVTDRREFEDFAHRRAIPKKGNLLYVCGPNRNSNPSEYWVALIASNWQQVTIKPKDESFWLDEEQIQTDISFERAIEMAKEMIKNPNKILKP